MKKITYSFSMITLFFLFGGCKKEKNYVANELATIKVINGIVNEDVKLRMNGRLNSSGATQNSNQDNTVYYGGDAFFYADAKPLSVDFLKASDESVLASQTFNIRNGGIYSLILGGIFPNVETTLIDDTDIPIVDVSITPADADSVIFVRFINLSPDTQPLDIRIAGASTNEVSGLAYQSHSSFKAFPARNARFIDTFGYDMLNFEVIENGIVIQTYSMFVFEPANRFKNVALVITGRKNPDTGQPGLAISAVNYFQ